jgi:hypothetical protein
MCLKLQEYYDSQTEVQLNLFHFKGIILGPALTIACYLGSIVTGGGGADEDVTVVLRMQMWHLCSCIGFGKTRM